MLPGYPIIRSNNIQGTQIMPGQPTLIRGNVSQIKCELSMSLSVPYIEK